MVPALFSVLIFVASTAVLVQHLEKELIAARDRDRKEKDLDMRYELLR